MAINALNQTLNIIVHCNKEDKGTKNVDMHTEKVSHRADRLVVINVIITKHLY